MLLLVPAEDPNSVLYRQSVQQEREAFNADEVERWHQKQEEKANERQSTMVDRPAVRRQNNPIDEPNGGCCIWPFKACF